VSDNTENKEQPQEAQPSMEQKVKDRIAAAIAPELKRLEVLAESMQKRNDTEGYCHAIEAIASTKARAEVYGIQVEMAIQTAALASVVNTAMRGQGQQGRVPGGPERPGDLDEIVRKGSRPGQESPSDG